MKAPKLKSIFRNVRVKPRQFSYKSRYKSELREDWEERKRRIEGGLPSNISFGKRRESVNKASRSAMIRTATIGAILVYATYRMILWAEATEWNKMLEFIRENG